MNTSGPSAAAAATIEPVYNSFSTANVSTSFMNSNSAVAKLAFLLLACFGFVIFLRVGTAVLAYFLKSDDSPHLIDGMVDASQMLIYPQDPAANDAVTIYRSSNAVDGIEFTWSVWIYINNLDIISGKGPAAGTYKHIFSKGNSDMNDKGLVQPNNAPGLYIAPNTNALVVIMNTFDVINDEVIIPDIPLNKWVNVIISCQNTTLDVYINGVVTRSVQLLGVPKQNYGDVYVGMNGGFDGYISNLWYYNYALGTTAIQNLSAAGPNTKFVGGNQLVDKMFNYLSMRWYF